MIHFDHIEIHVKNSYNYVLFLKKFFPVSRFKKISENLTYMFLTGDGIRFEIKENKSFDYKFDINTHVGFCLPCLRMEGAMHHIEAIQEVAIFKIIDNPDGPCIFFKDYEGIDWHIKDYTNLDVYTNI
jgi:hypothetical protein